MRKKYPYIHKEMLPVGNRSAIDYAIEEGISAGILNIIIIINHQKESIREYIENKKKKGGFPDSCSFTFLYQVELQGEADAISLAKDLTGNHSISVVYPDNIYFPAPGALTLLKKSFMKYKKEVIALHRVLEAYAHGISHSGKVDLEFIDDDVFRITRFYPKGEGHYKVQRQNELRTCGMWISGPNIFDYFEKARSAAGINQEFTDFHVRLEMMNSMDILGYRLPGILFDIGNPAGYELCKGYLKSSG
jgi:UTP--glucose-1-phosphate uridylyltransferase